MVELGGRGIAIQAAKKRQKAESLGYHRTENHRYGNRDAMHNRWLTLLHSDRDFDPFVRHLGLRSVLKQAERGAKSVLRLGRTATR